MQVSVTHQVWCCIHKFARKIICNYFGFILRNWYRLNDQHMGKLCELANYTALFFALNEHNHILMLFKLGIHHKACERLHEIVTFSPI